jgi:hypothetical protein
MQLTAFAIILVLAANLAASAQPSSAAACIDLKQAKPLRFNGVLTREVFPGAPNYEDIHKGDKPEPAYILRLRESICVTGDTFVDSSRQIDRIQIFPANTTKKSQVLWKQLRGFVGRSVAVDGREPFGAHTGHHHAPLLLPITKIRIVSHR